MSPGEVKLNHSSQDCDRTEKCPTRDGRLCIPHQNLAADPSHLSDNLHIDDPGLLPCVPENNT